MENLFIVLIGGLWGAVIGTIIGVVEEWISDNEP